MGEVYPGRLHRRRGHFRKYCNLFLFWLHQNIPLEHCTLAHKAISEQADKSIYVVPTSKGDRAQHVRSREVTHFGDLLQARKICLRFTLSTNQSLQLLWDPAPRGPSDASSKRSPRSWTLSSRAFAYRYNKLPANNANMEVFSRRGGKPFSKPLLLRSRFRHAGAAKQTPPHGHGCVHVMQRWSHASRSWCSVGEFALVSVINPRLREMFARRLDRSNLLKTIK